MVAFVTCHQFSSVRIDFCLGILFENTEITSCAHLAMTIDFLLNKYILKFIRFDIVTTEPNMMWISNTLQHILPRHIGFSVMLRNWQY